MARAFSQGRMFMHMASFEHHVWGVVWCNTAGSSSTLNISVAIRQCQQALTAWVWNQESRWGSLLLRWGAVYRALPQPKGGYGAGRCTPSWIQPASHPARWCGFPEKPWPSPFPPAKQVGNCTPSRAPRAPRAPPDLALMHPGLSAVRVGIHFGHLC